MNTNLPTGNYMKIEDVKRWVERYTCRKDHKIVLPVYENEYFNTVDLKSIFPKRMFTEMECKVITFMIEVK